MRHLNPRVVRDRKAVQCVALPTDPRRVERVAVQIERSEERAPRVSRFVFTEAKLVELAI